MFKDDMPILAYNIIMHECMVNDLEGGRCMIQFCDTLTSEYPEEKQKIEYEFEWLNDGSLQTSFALPKHVEKTYTDEEFLVVPLFFFSCFFSNCFLFYFHKKQNINSGFLFFFFFRHVNVC